MNNQSLQCRWYTLIQKSIYQSRHGTHLELVCTVKSTTCLLTSGQQRGEGILYQELVRQGGGVQYTVYNVLALYTVLTLYNKQCTMYLHCTLYTVLTLYSVQYTYTVHCTLYSVHCIQLVRVGYGTRMMDIKLGARNVGRMCTINTVQCTFYNVHCTLYSVQCTQLQLELVVVQIPSKNVPICRYGYSTYTI